MPRKFGRDADIEGEGFRRDGSLLVQGVDAVKRAIEGDHIVVQIVPGNVQLALGADKGNGADGFAGARGSIRAGDDKSFAMVRRMPDADAAGGCSARGRVPGDVHRIAPRTRKVRIGRNHGLVVENAAACFERKEGGLRIRLAAVGERATAISVPSTPEPLPKKTTM